MDEQEARIAAESDARLAAVFRDAAAHAPPAGFDAGDVVATSRRITRRRRSALAGGALAVVAVAGIGLAGIGGRSDAPLTTASAGAAAGSAAGAPADPAADAAGVASGGAPEAARAAPAPAPGAPAGAAPLGPGTGECADRQDPALRALVEQALPEVVGAPGAATTQECRPGGERGVALEVGGGVFAVTYLPPGTVASVPEGTRTASTASGGTVLVSSRAGRAGAPAPFADRLDAVAAALAPRL